MIRTTWTGAAGLIFESESDIILIDPYFTRVNLFNTLLGPISPDERAVEKQLDSFSKPISAVIVGHTHSDHALDVPLIVRKTHAQPVGSRSLETLMAISGIPGRTMVCDGGETVVLNERAAVTMIPSAHGRVILNKVPFQGEIRATAVLPMKAGGYRVGTVFAPKLQIDGITFLHIGSAGFIEEALQGHSCDVLFLCVAGWKKRQGYPQRIIETTRPRTVVLIHYDDFSKPHRDKTRKLPFLDMGAMIRTIKAQSPKIEVLVPEIGAGMNFE
jgi:L-ascorbate metabolism protein UlaG (beta-lactamase superfamily)